MSIRTAYDESAEFALEASGVTKSFGQTQALAGLDFAVEPGTVLGVLGPNGSGKTTAVRVLTTLLEAGPWPGSGGRL